MKHCSYADRKAPQVIRTLVTEAMNINCSWEPKSGDYVEVRRFRSTIRHGHIDDVMQDNSGFWLAADGVEPRVFVPLDDREIIIKPLAVRT